MPLSHPPAAQLERLLDEQPWPRRPEIVAHLVRCAACRRRLGALSASARPRPQPEGHEYDQVFSKVFTSLMTAVGSLRDDRRAAPHLLAELLAVPSPRRRMVVINARRFRSRSLAAMLLEEARSAWSDDPEEAGELASLALEITRLLDDPRAQDPTVSDLRARAVAYLANSWRIRSDLRRAERGFRQAERLLAAGTGDPLEMAQLMDLEASFYRDQRRLDEAAERLRRAVNAYRRAGERTLVCRALIKEAMLRREAGRPDEGVPLLRRALAEIATGGDHRLRLSAQHNLVTCLNEGGRPEEAQRLLPRVRKLALRLGNRLDLLRVRWLDGQVATNLGQLTRAEWSLLAARDGFVGLGFGYDVAMVSLDLAGLYLRQGRTDETRRLAAEVVPLLRAQDVHREALAAALLFAEAAERETLTLRRVTELAGRLRGARSRNAP